MRGTDRVERQYLFPRVEISNTGGHIYKVRGRKFNEDVQGRFSTESVVGAGTDCHGWWWKLISLWHLRGFCIGTWNCTGHSFEDLKTNRFCTLNLFSQALSWYAVHALSFPSPFCCYLMKHIYLCGRGVTLE